MDRITSVESNRFSNRICFDDGSSLNVRKKDIEQFKLAQGVQIDKDAFYQRLCAAQFNDGYEAALNMLDRSAKTEQEIRNKLKLKGYLSEVADAVCERLKGARLIDDGYIAERLTRSMVASGKGCYAVAQKLRARGIGKEESLEALESIDEEEQKQSALAQAKKLLNKYADQEPRARKMKLSQALARRGFSWDSIEYVLDALDEEADDLM